MSKPRPKPSTSTPSGQEVELLGEQTGAVRIQMRPFQGRPNVSVVQFAIDYSKAETPDRAYYADYCDVVKARSGYSLFFGKLIPGTIDLRTKVEISFPADMFFRQLWRSTRDLHETARKAWSRSPLEPMAGARDTDKVQTFRANNIFVAILGEESLLDFYYIAPSDIYFVQSGQRHQAHLEPVIRITLPAPLVFEFLEKCQARVNEGPNPDDIDILDAE